MRRSSQLLAFVLAAVSSASGAYVSGDWVLTRDGTTGVSALQLAVTSESTIIILDKAENNPLLTNRSKPAMAAELNLNTRQVRPLNGARSNVWCSGGGFLRNGTFIEAGGNPHEPGYADNNGLQVIRHFDPCEDASCDLFDDSGRVMRMTSPRWYPGMVRIDDGSLMIFGGQKFNDWINNATINNPTYEFYPPKNIHGMYHSQLQGLPEYRPLPAGHNGTQIPMKFMKDTLRSNLFPYSAVLPDGKIFITGNNQTTIFDWKKNKETRLPPLPNGVRISYPFSGGVVLLPLTPENKYTPEFLICGGSAINDRLHQNQISSQTPASTQCSRMVLTKEGIAKGWQVEQMPVPRHMVDMFPLPDGRIMIMNGAMAGMSAYPYAIDAVGESDADHPAFQSYVYDPDAPEGKRFSMEGMPASTIARMYHSGATLTPNGTIFIAGSNPNEDVCFAKYNTEYRAEYLDPPYMFKPRPSYTGLKGILGYNETFELQIELPEDDCGDLIMLIDLGYTTHGVHMGTRSVKLVSHLSKDGTTLTVTGPPTPQIYPPGPGYVYVVTSEGVPSFGRKTIVGDGLSPPTDEAARIGMLENTNAVNITYRQPRVLPTCGQLGGGESITGSFLPTAVTGNTKPTSTDTWREEGFCDGIIMSVMLLATAAAGLPWGIDWQKECEDEDVETLFEGLQKEIDDENNVFEESPELELTNADILNGKLYNFKELDKGEEPMGYNDEINVLNDASEDTWSVQGIGSLEINSDIYIHFYLSSAATSLPSASPATCLAARSKNRLAIRTTCQTFSCVVM
ncbi:hypothetical protein D9758_007636 [Tetrapyrgos nigripes]|uniref:Glyoxal oxidase n=1 Tax=Tetrapyrgos nigripes TaxID=182062 RepID=A0A8H5G834_9AGAR|nr:hypothetical protein D9758_007636 [Tetrapyrgos nigripes]